MNGTHKFIAKLHGFQHVVYVWIQAFLSIHVNNCIQFSARLCTNPVGGIYKIPARIYKNPASTVSSCKDLLTSGWNCVFSCRIYRFSCRPILLKKGPLRQGLRTRRPRLVSFFPAATGCFSSVKMAVLGFSHMR